MKKYFIIATLIGSALSSSTFAADANTEALLEFQAKKAQEVRIHEVLEENPSALFCHQFNDNGVLEHSMSIILPPVHAFKNIERMAEDIAITSNGKTKCTAGLSYPEGNVVKLHPMN